MKIQNIPVGPLQVNCFVVYDEEKHDAVVIDPGDEPGKIIGFIEAAKLSCIFDSMYPFPLRPCRGRRKAERSYIRSGDNT